LFFDVEEDAGSLTLVVEAAPGNSDVLIDPITDGGDNQLGKVLSDYFLDSETDLAAEFSIESGLLGATLTGFYHFQKIGNDLIASIDSVSELLFSYDGLDVMGLTVTGNGAFLLNSEGGGGTGCT
jgi:hypothetical protein